MRVTHLPILAACFILLPPCLSCTHPALTGVRTEPPATGVTAGSAAPSGRLRVAVPAGLRDRIVQALAVLDAPSAQLQPVLVAEGAASDITVIPSIEMAPDVKVARHWSVAAAASRIDLDEVTLDRLVQQAKTGPLYVAAEQRGLVAALFADASGLIPVPAAELPSRLASNPDTLAIVPSDAATVSVHILALDGIDPVRASATVAEYPLTTRVRITATRRTPETERLASALSEALSHADPAVTTVLFTGDIIPTRCVYDQMRRVGDWAAPFVAVASRFAAADLVIGSLDASISDVGDPIGCEETFNLLAPPQVVQGFQAAHLKAMTVAANHAKDCGRAVYCADRAFLDTLANLRAAGIEPAGGGSTAQDARRPAVLTVNGLRFAILGYDDIAEYYHATTTTPGTAGLDLSTLADDVRAAARDADVVVVMPHWGIEYTPNPTDRQQRAARIAVEAGATLVVGNHPHVVQAAAPLGAGYAAYALGNFVFDQDWSAETTQGVVLETVFRGSHLAEIRIQAVEIRNRLQPVFLGEAAAAPVLRRISDAAARLSP